MNKKPVLHLMCICSGLLLGGCQTFESSKVPSQATQQLQQAVNATAVNAAPAEVPAAVTQDLLSGAYMPQQPELPRFNVAAVQADLADFFQSLVADTPYSVVLHPDVSGQITLQLKQVTLPETIALVQQLYGFDIRQQGMVYKVYPAGLRTETIAVNYLMLQRQGFSSIAVNSGGVSQDNQNGQNGQSNRNNNSQSNLNQGLGNNAGQYGQHRLQIQRQQAKCFKTN